MLSAASENPETLRVLLSAGAAKNGQRELDRALLGAARDGKLESVKQLIEAGADPNADFSDKTGEDDYSSMGSVHGQRPVQEIRKL